MKSGCKNESIFGSIDYLEKYEKLYSLKSGFFFSHSFLNCANEKLTIDFIRRTGCINTRKVLLSTRVYWIYFGKLTRLLLHLSLNGHSYGDVWISYQSRSGKQYKMHKDDWDCNDVDFWFEDLNVAAVNAQLNHNSKLPFSVKGLDFAIEVNGLHLDGVIDTRLSVGALANAHNIANQVIDFVHSYNQKAEAKEQGVVHHISFKETTTGILFAINYGTVGIAFLKKLLKFMNGLQCFAQVTLDGPSY